MKKLPIPANPLTYDTRERCVRYYDYNTRRYYFAKSRETVESFLEIGLIDEGYRPIRMSNIQKWELLNHALNLGMSRRQILMTQPSYKKRRRLRVFWGIVSIVAAVVFYLAAMVFVGVSDNKTAIILGIIAAFFLIIGLILVF